MYRAFPEQLKSDLKIPSEPGLKPYVIVIPIRKRCRLVGAGSGQAGRDDAGTYGSLGALSQDGKRKLYHSSGLDDLDFITYFETSKLEDFHSLVLALEKVKEFQDNRRLGHPTLLGTVRSLDELIEVLAQ